MICFMCKGHMEDKNTTFLTDIEGCVIIIKNVPSQVCKQCGDTTYDNTTARQIEKIVDDEIHQNREISVLIYPLKVA